MRAYIQRNGKELSDNVKVADTLFQRMKGLLGREGLTQGEALLLTPCNSIQTMFMRFPIDAAFLDKENNIVAVKNNLAVNRLTGVYFRARSVLELPAGTLEKSDARTGDRIVIG